MSEQAHVDVVIVGAGLSGICAAYHLKEKCPTHSFTIVESRQRIGGTWDLFKYPGIRSDSDMFTLGYSFKPWTAAKGIADGPDILQYVNETAEQFDITKHIRFGRRVVRSEWCSTAKRWTVHTSAADDQGSALNEVGDSTVTCGFLFFCSGYYDYFQPYTPEWKGVDSFQGEIIHPQMWTQQREEGPNYEGKRVVVIGSGATAVTLVPAMADSGAAHVTMLQRSPTYMVSVDSVNWVNELFKSCLPQTWAYSLIRWKQIMMGIFFFQLSKAFPSLVKGSLIKDTRALLPSDFDVDTHFTPRYNPWDQRICLVPDADLFKSISAGRVSIVTDTIETFTDKGIQLTSGEHVDADLVVTATGLTLQACGGSTMYVDGKLVALQDHMMYKGAMVSGVPNCAMAMGYTNASWTLKCDLSCEFVTRILNHMKDNGQSSCTPTPHNDVGTNTTAPILNLTSGYIQRGLAIFPKQGPRQPWQLNQNYLSDIRTLRFDQIDDGELTFR
eukprot:TRINITY_DN1325_c0_g1_i1.p1 TRINITY_DN1325_c0_g1~~TRINITY_DN1325_c0_g1_i1.p1  ORF type:complete len:499 (+),score=82.71 TRINITY_DN1325_c0_g1_i1:150-1646(+)